MFSLKARQGAFFLLLICLFTKVFGNIIVETKSGKIEGKEVKSIIKNEKYYSFLSIHYAKPPVGELRFMPPVAHPGWDDVLQAKKEKKHCAQYNLSMKKKGQYGFCGDEDCLHLSIHTPSLPKDDNLKLPVIVFLYNELFKVSSNGTKEYKPDFFMSENVIIVHINYRIGALGFLSFEDELIPGNNGIKDVILALNWLNENIGNFGGDPSRVTLMGHGGGAVIVDILIHSTQSKGLFNGAILQSGSSQYPNYFCDNPRKRAIQLSEALESKATTSKSLLERLSEVPALEITEKELLSVHADEARAIQRGIIPFCPILEIDHKDAVLTNYPENTDIPINIPVMIGFNSREGLEMNSRYLRMPRYLTYAERDFLMLFPKRVDYHFQINDEIYNKMIQEIKDFYFEEGYVKISKPGEYHTYIGDILSVYPMDQTIRHYTNRSSAPVHYYMFDYSGELNFRKKLILEDAITFDGTWGASIGDDLCYLFVCNQWRKTYVKLLQDEESEEIAILKKMVKMYTDFAKIGNPTPAGSDFVWEPATKENRECLVISDEPKMVSNLYSKRIKFWDDFIEKYKSMAVDGVVKDVRDEL